MLQFACYLLHVKSLFLCENFEFNFKHVRLLKGLGPTSRLGTCTKRIPMHSVKTTTVWSMIRRLLSIYSTQFKELKSVKVCQAENKTLTVIVMHKCTQKVEKLRNS